MRIEDEVVCINAHANRSVRVQRGVELIEEGGGGGGGGNVSTRICTCARGSCVWKEKPVDRLPPNLTNSCGGSDGYCITDCSRSTCALVGDPRVTGPTACWYNPAHERQLCGCRENACAWLSVGERVRDLIRRYPGIPATGPEFGLLNAIIHAPNDEVKKRLTKNLERFQARYDAKFDSLEAVELPGDIVYLNATKRVRILLWTVPINNEYHTNADGIVVVIIKNLWGRLLPYEVSTTPIQPQPPAPAPTD